MKHTSLAHYINACTCYKWTLGILKMNWSGLDDSVNCLIRWQYISGGWSESAEGCGDSEWDVEENRALLAANGELLARLWLPDIWDLLPSELARPPTPPRRGSLWFSKIKFDTQQSNGHRPRWAALEALWAGLLLEVTLRLCSSAQATQVYAAQIH